MNAHRILKYFTNAWDYSQGIIVSLWKEINVPLAHWRIRKITSEEQFC